MLHLTPEPNIFLVFLIYMFFSSCYFRTGGEIEYLLDAGFMDTYKENFILEIKHFLGELNTNYSIYFSSRISTTNSVILPNVETQKSGIFGIKIL